MKTALTARGHCLLFFVNDLGTRWYFPSNKTGLLVSDELTGLFSINFLINFFDVYCTKEAIAEGIAEGNSSNATKRKKKTLKSALQIMVLFNFVKARKKSCQFIRDSAIASFVQYTSKKFIKKCGFSTFSFPLWSLCSSPLLVSLAVVCGEERCVTILKTAARETSPLLT